MKPTSPARPKEHSLEEEKAVILDRLKTLDIDRKNAIPATEAFRRILEKSKP